METEREIIARVLDENGPVIAKFRDRWDHLDRLPSRARNGERQMSPSTTGSLCVIAAREHPRLDDVVEIRDVALITDPG